MNDVADTQEPSRLLPMDAAAMNYARRFNLITEDGQVVCIRDYCGQPATLPTLLCRGCLEARRRRYP